MNKLNISLLMSDELQEFDFDSIATGARGSYSPMQFVVRLRDDIHKALNEEGMSYERVQAFSTYMHETIHWWQHVGSHIGFLTSLSYPAIAHASHKDLKTLIARGEKYKSVADYDALYFAQHGNHGVPEVNRILNNWYDTHYAKSYILDNKNIHKILLDERFFLSIGHSFHILWSSSINTLASTIDPNYEFLPKVAAWSDEFKRLEAEKVRGFYINSDMGIAPIGTRAIFEGQARFNQLQYLAIALGNTFTYTDFEQEGMLSGLYVEAFELFLKVTGLNKPVDLNNPTIGLFLLVCDIAINPTDGFPHDILHFETFIISNDPGLRFVMLCQEIRKDQGKWATAVQDYSNAEYIGLSQELCEAIVCFPPLVGSGVVMNWVKNNQSVQTLLDEESLMKFSPQNLSIRLFLSKYIRFQEDKLAYPSIFCWTGKSMTGEASKELNLELVEKIFNKHRALFIDDIGGEIKPMMFDGFQEENVVDTFQAFYTYNTTYDMIMKWILQSGEFTYDYRWLTSKFSEEEMRNWIRENFKNTFEVYPEELITLR